MTNEHREAFIPYRRTDIMRLCLEDGRLQAEEAQAFESFGTMLTAFYHFQLHGDLETIKDNYAVFNPDTDVRPLFEPTAQAYEQMHATVVDAFKQILGRANYIPMPDETIQRSLADRSLIALKTAVDFNDFDEFLCYYRGDVDKTITRKKVFFWQAEQTVDILERLVLLIKFKGEGYFRSKEAQSKRQSPALKFEPGKMYVYFYKNIPKLDLDLLFPNIQTSMTWRDRLMLAVPAAGAAIAVILKALPNILLLVAAILIAFNARSTIESINIEEEQARTVMPVLIATLTLVIALGGFVTKQYSQYKSKQIKFQKDVADTLFFKNLATNASAFQSLVDLAEEEECKEIILVYYHLLTSAKPLTPEELDSAIEAWMLEKTGTAINFDIHGPLQNLQNIRGFTKSLSKEQPLLRRDQDGRCRVLPLLQAREVIDSIWDSVF